MRKNSSKKNLSNIKKVYRIPAKIDWDIQLNKHGFVATSKSIPGLVTNASNPVELLEMMNDAVLEYFDVPKHETDYIYDRFDLAGQGTIRIKQSKKRSALA
jgi:hypothetical protein